MMRRAMLVILTPLLVAADAPQAVDVLRQRAEPDFNMRDRNGDGFLNHDEMPDELKAELTKWDTNRDNLISLDEYKFFYGASTQKRHQDRDQPANPFIIIKEEDDLDARPVILRAGKLHTKELPNWFMALDTDKDGQIALWEWRRAGKKLDEFRLWDRNDDGYITAEEAIYKQQIVQAGGTAPQTTNNSVASHDMTRRDNADGLPRDIARGGRGRKKGQQTQ
jgi:Ca2+-binding EF-hand superfamily protein